MNPEYFPSSYLKPAPTGPVNKDLLKRGFANGLSFPRSTITGTLEDFRILLRCSFLSKSNQIPAETYRALSLDLSSGALDATDKATAPKRISALLRLCSTFIPCEHAEYDDEAVQELNAEVADDLADAKLILEDVQGNFVPAIVKLESEAPSVLLQVLYALHLGHVQFLMAEYKSRIIEAYPNAFARVRPPRLGKDGLPLKIKDVGSTANSSDNTVDMSTVDDDDSTTSDIDLNEGSRSEANTFTSSTSQMVSRPPQKGTATPSESSEVAGFGSDTSARTETGDNDELGQAEDN
jgi:hypothetical protein